MEEQLLKVHSCCPLCKSQNFVTVLKLQDTPLEDQFLKNITNQSTYPLELALCNECGYVFLPHRISPEASYSNYIYVSGVTVGLRNHYDSYARQIISDYEIPGGSLVVDLGSNDGSMLASFKKAGMKVIGVEPAQEIAKKANEIGLYTIPDFFSKAVVETIHKSHGQAKVITANYMYANIDEVIGFTNNVGKLLDKKGIFVIQTGYHPEQMKKMMFDYIYHEHFSYFSVEVIKNLFDECGLELISATKISPKGGSIRLVGQIKGGPYLVDETVEKIVIEERKSGIAEKVFFKNFEEKIQKSKDNLLNTLNYYKQSKLRVVGLGASHSTTTLIYHFGLANYIEYLVDDNVLKHGCFSPGLNIPVNPVDRLYQDNIDVAIILAWQHKDTIIKKHSSFLNKGKFVIPLPEIEILGD